MAADEVGIFLQDSKQYVKGEMLFNDGKYAFVAFDYESKICNKDDIESCFVKAKRKIPLENVTIIKIDKKQKEKNDE